MVGARYSSRSVTPSREAYTTEYVTSPEGDLTRLRGELYLGGRRVREYSVLMKRNGSFHVTYKHLNLMFRHERVPAGADS